MIGALAAMQASAGDADIAAIRDLQTQQRDAWNHHDAAAYSSLFTQDGDVVNVQGWWWKGREEIRRKLTGAFAYVFRDSQLSFSDVDVRLLNDQFAVVHVRWTLQGAKVPPGAAQPPHEGIQLQVLRKEQGRWRILSFQNTNSVPETEFPQGHP
jgi:uncharacterized protein (TIGR02246 family)